MVERERRRAKIVKRYAATRAQLKETIRNPRTSPEAREAAQAKLQSLPRVKDFRGLKPTSFDGRGNYALGLKEHIVFPEINYDQIDQIWGMDIIITTTAKTDEEARQLLREFQFPFTA